MGKTPSSLTHAERGMLGARKRWGPPRVVRLDLLSPEQRRIVLALVKAQELANDTAEDGGQS